MDPDPDPAARPRLTATRRTRAGTWAGTALLVLVTVAAAVPRVLLWWQDRSFWRDEIALIQSLDTFSVRQLLLGPLSDAQAAPPLWLLATRTITAVLGDGERAYRMLPVASAVGGLVLLAVLAALLVRHRWTAAVPVVVASTASEAVYYAAQAKPYTADVLLVTGLMVLAVLLLRAGAAAGSPPGWRIWWYVAITVGAWLSYGVMISAPLLAVWVLAVQLRRRQFGPGPRGAARAAGELLVPAASVLGAALWAHHLTGRVAGFQSYWSGFLGPRTTDAGTLARWHRLVFSDLFLREVGARWWLPALLLVAAGFAVLVRRHRAEAVVLILPLLAAYVAGAAGVYPFGRRLVMFCVPGLLVCLAGLVDGAAGLGGRLGARLGGRRGARFRQRAGSAAAIGGGLLASAVVLACAWTVPARLSSDLTYLYGVDDYRGAFRYVSAHWRDGDELVVGNGDRAAARVYGPGTGLPTAAILRASPATDGARRRGCPLPPAVLAAPRVWLLTDDVVGIYPGTVSRASIVAPMLDRFHLDHRRVKGLVTVQLLLPGGSPDADPARCLVYTPLGHARDTAMTSPLSRTGRPTGDP